MNTNIGGRGSRPTARDLFKLYCSGWYDGTRGKPRDITKIGDGFYDHESNGAYRMGYSDGHLNASEMVKDAKMRFGYESRPIRFERGKNLKPPRR